MHEPLVLIYDFNELSYHDTWRWKCRWSISQHLLANGRRKRVSFCLYFCFFGDNVELFVFMGFFVCLFFIFGFKEPIEDALRLFG